jgi:hypothetical protein
MTGKIIKSSLFAAIVIWLMFAFVKGEINPFNYEEAIRFLMMYLLLLAIVFIVVAIRINNSNQQ